ncbi:glycosyltransferase family 4 protein [Rhodohalobacter mucosus]|uniref:Glycosyltransferase n=1 Tax=Rhodohalobacter mucosus TaxID=2079485 RepID=A0A316TV60_9BACT|nr:glycosyltransferase family 4 protein [Rhodohalobacter mucosus]PWN06292.1 glycosyltransferase [Rhodohalobacter mucosus]
MKDSKHILIIGTVWPEPDSSAAGSRMMQLINLFQKSGWKVTFASPSAKSEHSEDLEQLNIRCAAIEMNSSTFDDFIRKEKPDAVMFDRFMIEEQFGWRVAENCPEAIRILDTEDLHCLRNARKKAVEEGRSFAEKDLFLDNMAKREIASIYRCDLSLIISVYEYDLLRYHFGIDKSLLCHLPFLFEPIEESQKNSLPSFDERSGFITIGNFLHEPNRDAVIQLKEQVWPLITKKLPEARLHVYGAYPSQHIFDLHNEEEGFLVHGRADDSFDVVSRAKVLLAPLRFGAGLKGKLIESMICGTPSVTTTIGAEGINGYLPWPGAVSENPEIFAASAVELYRDKFTWQRASEYGFKILELRFLRERHEKRFKDTLRELMSGLVEHRKTNFTGAMLMHHTMAGTRYMSKWIEEKNKIK